MRRRALVLAVALACGACGGAASNLHGQTSTSPRMPAARRTAAGAASGRAGSSTTGRSATGSVVRSATGPSAAASATGANAAASAPPNPGALPQTDQLPSANTTQFGAEMAALWAGVVENSVAAAMPAFFPEAAYVQVKGIADPRADYIQRLVGEFRLDLAAAHALLGPVPASARLLAVRVPAGYAHWVTPGTCYNTVGYWEVPNARVVYRQGGQVRSFGIASMISWRGVWYVVHLGAVVRSSVAGVVDDPSSGPGVSAPSSTC